MGLLLLMPTFWAVPTCLLSLTLHLSPSGSHLPFQAGVHPFYSPDNGALMAELVSTFTFV